MSSREHKRITVEYAKRLVEAEAKNKLCRPLDLQAVRQMAGRMSAGLWRETNEAITIDADGNLYNGLMRMAAIVESGVEVMMWVVTLDSVRHGKMNDDTKFSADENNPEAMHWELLYWRQEKILRATQVSLEQSQTTIQDLHRLIRAALLASGKLEEYSKQYVERWSKLEDLLLVGRRMLDSLNISVTDTLRALTIKERLP